MYKNNFLITAPLLMIFVSFTPAQGGSDEYIFDQIQVTVTNVSPTCYQGQVIPGKFETNYTINSPEPSESTDADSEVIFSLTSSNSSSSSDSSEGTSSKSSETTTSGTTSSSSSDSSEGTSSGSSEATTSGTTSSSPHSRKENRSYFMMCMRGLIKSCAGCFCCHSKPTH